MTWLRITVRSRSRDPTQQRFPELLARERPDIIIVTDTVKEEEEEDDECGECVDGDSDANSGSQLSR